MRNAELKGTSLFNSAFRIPHSINAVTSEEAGVDDFFATMERLQAMLDSDDVEVITNDGQSIRGRIDNLRSTQPFSKPAVKIRGQDGKIRKVLFSNIKELIDHKKSDE
jgi:hypothetical protein